MFHVSRRNASSAPLSEAVGSAADARQCRRACSRHPRRARRSFVTPTWHRARHCLRRVGGGMKVARCPRRRPDRRRKRPRAGVAQSAGDNPKHEHPHSRGRCSRRSSPGRRRWQRLRIRRSFPCRSIGSKDCGGCAVRGAVIGDDDLQRESCRFRVAAVPTPHLHPRGVVVDDDDVEIGRHCGTHLQAHRKRLVDHPEEEVVVAPGIDGFLIAVLAVDVRRNAPNSRKIGRASPPDLAERLQGQIADRRTRPHMQGWTSPLA